MNPTNVGSRSQTVELYDPLTVVLSYLVFRIRGLRPVFEAKPMIVIDDGSQSRATFATSG